MNDLISVIVPVYKAEKTLSRCIQSLQKQTYRNLEIILVDDGSPDRCPKICDRYSRRDQRIKVIHQMNSGVSVARNVGLAATGGDIICFCDADDIMPKQSVERMYREMTKENADFVCGNYKIFYSTKVVSPSSLGDGIFLRENCNEIEKFLVEYNTFWLTSWGKLFRKDILTKNQIMFPEHLKMGEDVPFVAHYLRCCHKIVSVPETVYYYSRMQSSLSKSYYEDHYKADFAGIEALLTLFDRPFSPTVQSVIAMYCSVALSKQSVLPKEKACQRIKEVIDLFGQVTNDININDIADSKYASAKAYVKCHNFIAKHDYAAVYEFFTVHHNKVVEFCRTLWRKFTISVAQFLIYRLKWFFRN